jgi:uncharacterized membrane protein
MNTADRRIAEVERYIHELAIALSALPADEREDVIAGIREHIDDSLLAVSDPTPADVQRVLDELGDPLAIAADAGAPPPAATERSSESATSAASRTQSGIPLLRREWVPLAMIGSFALAGLLVFANNRITVVALGLWLLGLTTLVASPLWRATEKIVGVAAFIFVPAVAAVLFGWPYVRWSGIASDVLGPAPMERLLPPTFGFHSSLDGLLIVGVGLTTLGLVGAWLVHRGSVRSRR